MKTESPRPSERLVQLDGLRGIAALAVVFSHIVTGFRPQMYFGIEKGVAQTAQTWFATSPLFVFVNGSFAVYIFFALSGFVISASADRTQSALLPTILARIIRLSLPCAASLIFAATLINLGLTSASKAAEIVGHWWIKQLPPTFDNPAPWLIVLKYALGWYYVTGIAYFNGVIWTMKIELLGSLAIYIVFAFVRHPVWRAIAGVLIFVSVFFANAQPFYYSCFVAGSLIYLARRSVARIPSSIGAAALVAGLIVGGKPFFPPPESTFYYWPYRFATSIHGEMYIWPTGAVLTVLGALAWRPAVSLLGNPAARFLGRVSFSVYLVHFPLVGSALTYLFVRWGYKSDGAFAASALGYLLLVYALGYAFTIIIDEPATRLSVWVKRRHGRLVFRKNRVTESPGDLSEPNSADRLRRTLRLCLSRVSRCEPLRRLTQAHWPGILIFLVMVPSFYWIVSDHHVWPWDPAWYGETSVDLWIKLTGRLSKWAPAMLAAFGSKSPGIAWFGQFFVPLGRAMGSTEVGLLCSVVAVQVGSLVLFYKTAKELAPGKHMAAAAGILLFAGAPLFVAMSHQYFPEPLQLFGVTYFYFLAATGHRMRRVPLLGNLLLATAISLMAKMTSPIYCALPALIAAWFLFRDRDAGDQPTSMERRREWLAVIAGIVLCVACAAWYFRNFASLRGTLKLQTSLDFTADYGSPGTFFEKFSYWIHALQWSFQLPWVIAGQLVLFGASMGFAKFASLHRDDPPRSTDRRFDLLAICSAVHILTVLSLCSLNFNEENRYLLPLLPAVATINLWIIGKIRQPWIVGGVIALLISQWIAVCSQALGWTHLDGRTCSYWVIPFDGNRIPAKEITEVVRKTTNPNWKSRFNFVGVELPWLNATSLSFYAAKAQLKGGKRCYYSSLGYKENDMESAWNRLHDPKYHDFISLEETAQPANPNFLNGISAPILQRVRHDSAFIEEPFPSTLGIVIFRRSNEGPNGQSQESAQ